MTPGVGDWVRLVAPRGVTSPAMRAQVGEVGTVLEVRERDGALLVQARFAGLGAVDDVFWLKPGEWALVGPAPAEAPAPPRAPAVADSPAPERTKEIPVADFVTAVNRRIDQLAEQDAALGVQADDLERQRAEIARERRALVASVGARSRR